MAAWATCTGSLRWDSQDCARSLSIRIKSKNCQPGYLAASTDLSLFHCTPTASVPSSAAFSTRRWASIFLTIKLSKNPLTTIEADSFQQLASLTRLSLDQCQLKSINDRMFTGLVNLRGLSFEQQPHQLVWVSQRARSHPLRQGKFVAVRARSCPKQLV